MTDLSATAELEAELIKRNREIAKARDEVLKVERRLEEAQMRNDDLLEKVAELDSEVTSKNRRVTELEEKVDEITKMLLEKESNHESFRKEHASALEDLRKGHADKMSSLDEVTKAHDELKAKVTELQGHKDKLQEDLAEEQRRFKTTKTSLLESEGNLREHATKSLAAERRIKELEEELEEAKKGAAQTDRLEMERAQMNADVHNLNRMLEEHRSAREDLEKQLHTHNTTHALVTAELEDLKRDTGDHKTLVAELEAARDEAQRQHKELKSTHEEKLTETNKRSQEHLEKVMQQAAQLDGRLNGQRLMMQETNQALMKAELEEERLAEALKAKGDELSAEREATQAALEKAREEAAKDTTTLRKLLNSELEAEEVAMRRNARTEVDEHSRRADDADERHRRLEAEMSALRSDHDDALGHHGRQQDSLRAQQQDLRQRLAESEEKAASHLQEAERLKRDLEEARQEAERAQMAHRLEVERLQQTLEAEAQSRGSAEQIAQSRLEEKDTLLEHRKANVERLEQELEDHKKKMLEQKEAADKATDEAEQKAAAFGMKIASLEGVLKKRQERLTEVEGRLEAQRSYMEQLNETLAAAQNDRDALIQTKGSLEAQLLLESTHKNAVSESLNQQQEDANRRIKELEERIMRDRDSHQEAVEEARLSVQQEIKQNAERLAAVEAELVTARQRCEVLMRNKSDLQQEIQQHREKHTTVEAAAREQRATNERLGLELDQTKQTKASLEEELEKTRQEQRSLEAQLEDMREQAKTSETTRQLTLDEHNAKVKQLDQLLDAERGHRAAADKALTVHRQEADERHQQHESTRKKTEQELQAVINTWRSKAEETQDELDRALERIESQKKEAEVTDKQRRETESALRSDNATAEARLRRLETEAQRAQTAVEEGKAVLAQQQATMTAKIAELESQLEQETKHKSAASTAKEAAEKEVKKNEEGRRQMLERLGMAAEELAARQVDFTLERQRLSGALEESRRTLRSSLGVPNPGAAVDSVRLQGLEQQLSEERRKAIEQAVALQRAERKAIQLEESQKRAEDQRGDAMSRAREADRRASSLAEDLRKAKMSQAASSQTAEETREQAAMAVAEMATIKYEAKYEVVRLRGALDELRYMIKMQRPG